MSEYRPGGGFQMLPPVIKNLLIINVLVFATTYVLNNAGIINLEYYLALFHWDSPFFKPWQIITHIFMHANISHLLFNMFALWMFGNVIENVLGTQKFIIFYLICGLGAAVCHMLVFNWENAAFFTEYNKLTNGQQIQYINQTMIAELSNPATVPMVGASGAIFGLLFAFGYLFPNLMIYIYFLFPLKAKYFVAIYAIIELFAGIRSSPTDNVAHFAHLGGMLFAFLLLKMWKMSSKNMYRY